MTPFSFDSHGHRPSQQQQHSCIMVLGDGSKKIKIIMQQKSDNRFILLITSNNVLGLMLLPGRNATSCLIALYRNILTELN